MKLPLAVKSLFGRGSRGLSESLTAEFKGKGYAVLHDVALSAEYRGYHIDHLIGCPGGLVAITAPQLSGTVDGALRDEVWQMSEGDTVAEIPNLLRQSYRVSKDICDATGLPAAHVHHLVVVGDDVVFGGVRPAGIMTLDEAVAYIHELSGPVFSDEQLSTAVSTLSGIQVHEDSKRDWVARKQKWLVKKAKLATRKTHRSASESVRSYAGDLASPELRGAVKD